MVQKQAVRVATQCLRPMQVDNIFVFIRQVAPVPAYDISSNFDLLTLKVVPSHA